MPILLSRKQKKYSLPLQSKNNDAAFPLKGYFHYCNHKPKFLTTEKASTIARSVQNPITHATSNTTLTRSRRNYKGARFIL